MNKLFFSVLIFCAIAAVSFAGSPGSPPPDVCKAAQDYVSMVDSARSLLDPEKRRELYKEAGAKAAATMKTHNEDSLVLDCATYAGYVEGIITKDATDPTLPDLMDKRVKLREKLLGLCPM